MIYTVTFNPAIDYVLKVGDNLRVGALTRTTAEDFQFGGKGIHVSGVLKTLGSPSVVLGFVAGFTGQALEQGLQQQGVETDLICVEEGMTRINVKIKGPEETEINGMGPAITTADMEKLYQQLDKLQDGDTLVLSGSIPASLPQDTYETILQRLQHKKLQVVVDATKDLLVNTLKYKPFLIKPNHYELVETVGHALHTLEDIRAAAQSFVHGGVRHVVVSLGKDGALYVGEDGCFYAPEIPVEVRSTVGAGDALVGGLLYGLVTKGNMREGFRAGVAAGTASVMTEGTQLIIPDDFKHLLSQVQIQEL